VPAGRTRDKSDHGTSEKQLSHHAVSLKLPAARASNFVRHLYRSVRKLVRSIVARIDLSQFPRSCCG
jgi:hypothetical protein